MRERVRLILALDSSIPSLYHKRGSCCFHYPCTDLAYVELGSGTKHSSPARKDPWIDLRFKPVLLGWRAKVDLQPALDRDTGIKYINKYTSKPKTVSDGYHHALDNSCARMPQDLPAETRSGACLPGWPQTLTPPHKTQEAVYLLLGPSPRRAFPDHNKADDDDPARAFEASCYQARHATQENLSALTVIDLLQKRTVHFWNTVTCADAPPRPPTSCHLFANRAPPSSRIWPECVPHLPEVSCHSRLACANAIPNRSLAHFDARALLHKPFHAVE